MQRKRKSKRKLAKIKPPPICPDCGNPQYLTPKKEIKEGDRYVELVCVYCFKDE